MTRLFCIGDLTVDHLIGPFDRMPDWGQEVTYATAERRVGGNSGNVALAARLLGLEVECWGPIGNDESGRWLIAQLEDAGVKTDSVIVDPTLVTSTTTAMIRRDGERAFLTLPGSLDAIATHLASLGVKNADVAMFSGWCQPPRVPVETLRGAIARLRTTIPRIVFDLAWFDGSWSVRDDVFAVLAECDVAMMNQEEILALMPGADLMEATQGLSRRLRNVQVVVKRGRSGVLLCRGEETPVAVPVADPVDDVASVGTGDAFNAAFVAALEMGNASGEAAARFATGYVSHILRHGRQTPFDMAEHRPAKFSKHAQEG